MKKVKTIVSTMIIMLVSIFVSACSCTGTGDLNHIYLTDINIKCVDADKNVKFSDETGQLVIDCHVGEKFSIEYEITPSNATTTQVNWSFSQTGLVLPLARDYTRNKSTKEKVKFEAIATGQSNQTILTFTTAVIEKTVSCVIYVHEAVENLPTFVAPQNVRFDSDNNVLKWDHVKNIYLPGSTTDIGTATMGTEDGLAVGLDCYMVEKLNPETLEVVNTYKVLRSENVFGNKQEDKIVAGENYIFRVQAFADGNKALTSDFSSPYSFYKLEPVSNVTANNGELSFTTSAKSESHNVYNLGVKDTTTAPYKFTTTENSTSVISCSDIDGSFEKFNIQIVSYPKNYLSQNEYALDSTATIPTYYFPSDPTTPYVIQKLNKPVVSITNEKGTLSVGGVSFDNVNLSSYMALTVEGKGEGYETIYNQKFYYEIFPTTNGSTPVNDNKISNDGKIILDGLSAGSYRLKVRTVGNSNNTISSAVSEIGFNIIGSVKNKVTITDDQLSCGISLATGGYDLFFINVEDPSTAIYIELKQDNIGLINLDELNLPAGTYKVYAKAISYVSEDGNYKNIALKPANFENLYEIIISPTVVANKITRNGDILFAKLNKFNTYEVTVGRREKGTTGSYQTETVKIYYPNAGNESNLTYQVNVDPNTSVLIPYSDADYDNLTAKININDIVSSFISKANYGGMTLDMYFSSDYEFIYQIQTIGYVGSTYEQNQTVISSALTPEVKIQRFDSIPDFTLDNYNLRFPKVGTNRNQQYILGLEITEVTETTSTIKYSYLSDPFTGSVDGNNVVVDLKSFIINGNTFASLIHPEYNNTISIRAIGVDGKVNSPAVLDSLPTYKPFGVAGKPINLTVSENGLLEWESTTANAVEINYYYTLDFYRVTQEGETESHEYLESVYNLKASSYNIAEILEKYKGDVIGVVITESHQYSLNGEPSQMLYATRITSPELQRAHVEDKYLIQWNEVPNANIYNINVTKTQDPTFEWSVPNQGSNFFSITDRINAENGWKEGTYNFVVTALNTHPIPTKSSYETPYILLSPESKTTIYITSADIKVSVNNTNNTLTWDNICAGTEALADYVLSYTPKGGQTVIEEATKDFVYDASGFPVGLTEVIITPSIDFVNTAFIIIGNPYKNEVEKLTEATNLKTDGGNLVFEVHSTELSENISIELYSMSGETATLISPNNYSYNVETITVESDSSTEEPVQPVVDGEDGEDGDAPTPPATQITSYYKYTVILDGINPGEVTIKVRLSASGKLKGELSSESCTGTKIESVSNFQKSGEWLSWEAQDGVSTYQISYMKAGAGTPDVLDLYASDAVATDLTEESFRIFDGIYYYKFDHTLFVGDYTGDIVFTIRPLTIVENYFSGNTSDVLTVTKLNVKSTISVVDGKVNISDFEADGSATPTTYTITIYKITNNSTTDEPRFVRSEYWTITAPYIIVEGDALDITPIDLNEIGFTAEGDYEIELTYNGDGNNVITSAMKLQSDLDKLKTTILTTSGGNIAWNSVEGADNYTLRVSEVQGTLNSTGTKVSNATSVSGYYDIVVEGTMTDCQNLQYIATDENGQSQAIPFSFEPGKLYSVVIKANGKDKIHSKWSETFYVKKLYAPTELDLTTYEAGYPMITWSNTNTQNFPLTFEIKYTKDKDIASYFINPINDFKYPIDTNMASGVYDVTLKGFGNSSAGTDNIGYLTSNYSEPVDVNFVQEVTGVEVKEGIVSWPHINGAYSYKVTAYDSIGYMQSSWTGSQDKVKIYYTTYTTNTSIDFSTTKLNDLKIYNGGIIFFINAITDPARAIITTNEQDKVDNTATLFKPNVFTNYQVKDGRLNWKVTRSEIESFVESFKVTKRDPNDGSKFITTSKLVIKDVDTTDRSTTTEHIMKYVVGRINSNTGDSSLDEALSHLLKIKLKVNGVTIIDTPSQVFVDQNYQYIEYFYDVDIEPEIDTSIGGSSQEPEPSVQAENPAGIEYVAGKYTIEIAPVGNTGSATPVVNGNFTTELVAYKPNTPRAWTINGADIYLGKVQWQLSTTPNTTLNNFEYYYNYRITAYGINSEHVVNRDVIIDPSDPNIQDNYKYYRNLKNDLFVPNESGVTETNILNYNTYYRLLIRAIGTADSTQLNSGDKIYLNSNALQMKSIANILDTSASVKFENSEVSWDTSIGSTATKLYIYGPFGYWKPTKDSMRDDWVSDLVSDNILSRIYAVYNNDESVTAEEKALYTGMFRTIVLADGVESRKNKYTLTDQILDGKEFAPGGYIFGFQELGDNKGIVDSVISTKDYLSKYYSAIKLGYAQVRIDDDNPTNIMQSDGWVGVQNSKVYAWDAQSNTWNEMSLTGPNQTIGVFVWNPVIGANAYKVQLYEMQTNSSEAKLVDSATITTRETRYELPNNPSINLDGYTYYIRVIAVNTHVTDSTQLSNNYFSADYIDSTAHGRLPIPENLTISGDGRIWWNDGIQNTTIDSYRVRFNYGDEQNATEIIASNANQSVVPELDMATSTNQNGTIAIAVNAVPHSGSGLLRSSYCNSAYVTRLADPDVRLIDGVFYWGTGGDPVTPTELTIDNEYKLIEFKEGEVTYSTNYAYFTTPYEHNKDYTAEEDESKYPTGEHTFKVKFQGTGGENGTTIGGDEDFYIASNEKQLTAYKLSAPVVENVRLDISGTQENMVKWALDNLAQGYRVVIHSNILPTYIAQDFSRELINNLIEQNTSDEFLYVNIEDGITYVYLKLNWLLEAINGLGGELYVYVQALGSGLTCNVNVPADITNEEEKDQYRMQYASVRPGDETTLYLSSSYSTPTAIGVPPAPTGLSYNSNTGVFSWNLESETPYNIKIRTIYEVSNVTEEEVINYWQKTSDIFTFNNGSIDTATTDKYKPYSNISYRKTNINKVENNLYTLIVEDVIRLTASENGNKTPLSYQLTTIATNYEFYVTAMSFVDGTGDQFASAEVQLSGTYSFGTFGKGDGSENYKYTVESYTQLNAIRNFITRHFEFTANINMVDSDSKPVKWQPIVGKFTGSIDGKNHTISGYQIDQNNMPMLSTSSDTYFMSFVEDNAGIIKNITFAANIQYTYDVNVNVAGVAITNSGTIDNVSLIGTISVTAGNTGNQNTNRVAGIVIRNNGTISQTSVNAIITALDNGSKETSVGGIAETNRGAIMSSNFQGSIKGNRVGGIVAINIGNIDRCYVDNATINVTNGWTATNTTTLTPKSAMAGGIAAQMYPNSGTTPTITNSYSKAEINVTKVGGENVVFVVGGLVASLENEEGIEISNCYVVTNITRSSVSGTGTINTYYMLALADPKEGDLFTLTNNYYLVEKCDFADASSSSRDDAGCAKVDSLDILRTKLNDSIYDVATSYPTLKK